MLGCWHAGKGWRAKGRDVYEAPILVPYTDGWWCCSNLAAFADQSRIMGCVSLSFIGY